MLDIRMLREDATFVSERLKLRNENIDSLTTFRELDTQRRKLITQVEELKGKRNRVSQEVAKRKKANENADQLISEMRQVGDEIKRLDEQAHETEQKLEQILYCLPNLPHESVPSGTTEEENIPIRYWGEIPTPGFTLKPHWEIGQELQLLDFERASKVTGSRFVFYKGHGARLERALINFMLDLHTEKYGYTELIPPFIVNEQSMYGTGQFPKFADGVFKLNVEQGYYLIPTAEVPVTNFHQGEILSLEELPKYYAAFSACFRSEAGSAGRDTRGLIRHHQFNKVELVKLVHPDTSYDELESLTAQAEEVLQLLELPYRVVNLCTGDLGFSAAKTYDLEVWLPSSNTYREISSCSNFESFQARRANLRFRRAPKTKPEFLHTLNGSGLAVGRTVAAILENHQQADGSIRIPEALQPYFGKNKIE